jgi:hypothetical protein
MEKFEPVSKNGKRPYFQRKKYLLPELRMHAHFSEILAVELCNIDNI